MPFEGTKKQTPGKPHPYRSLMKPSAGKEQKNHMAIEKET